MSLTFDNLIDALAGAPLGLLSPWHHFCTSVTRWWASRDLSSGCPSVTNPSCAEACGPLSKPGFQLWDQQRAIIAQVDRNLRGPSGPLSIADPPKRTKPLRQISKQSNPWKSLETGASPVCPGLSITLTNPCLPRSLHDVDEHTTPENTSRHRGQWSVASVVNGGSRACGPELSVWARPVLQHSM